MEIDNEYHWYIDLYDGLANPAGYSKNPDYGSPALPFLKTSSSELY